MQESALSSFAPPDAVAAAAVASAVLPSLLLSTFADETKPLRDAQRPLRPPPPLLEGSSTVRRLQTGKTHKQVHQKHAFLFTSHA